MLGVSITLHGLANMGVNKTSNQQFLTSLVDLIQKNQKVLCSMNSQEAAVAIHSYVSHNHTINIFILIFLIPDHIKCSIPTLHIYYEYTIVWLI